MEYYGRYSGGRRPAEGKTDRAAGDDAGDYPIRQGDLTNENNPGYDIQFEEGTLTIEESPVYGEDDCGSRF